MVNFMETQTGQELNGNLLKFQLELKAHEASLKHLYLAI